MFSVTPHNSLSCCVCGSLRQPKIFWSFFDVNGKEVMEQGANITFCLKLRKTAKETYEIKFLKLFTEKTIPYVSSNGLKDSEWVARMLKMV
jgi:hypothetical protein